MYIPADLPRWRRAAELIGRRAECSVLDRLIADVRSGTSRALVLHGEPGVGKTALLDYLSVQSSGFRVVRAAGTESEVEMPFSGLHQLCAPLLDHLDHLPGPQREALRTVLGLSGGTTPDKFLVGLALLGLLSQAATERPLMCLVDDLQWLDPASSRTLTFVARRLHTESVGLVIATRAVTTYLNGLQDLAVNGLRPADAGALLDTVLTGPVDTGVRDQIIADTGGNPLALLELPRGLTPAELAGGFGLPSAMHVAASIEESFSRRAAALPEASRKLLLIAASDPSGDPALVWRAARALGVDAAAATPTIETGLAELGTRVRFHHPLARSAIYQSASEADRLRVHEVFSQVIDGQVDPDRKAWHRAHATVGPDEDVALELLRSAERAKARGGAAAAAAFLRRAAVLTPDPLQRATRALTAAEAQLQAGAFQPALDLLAMAESGPLDEFQHAQVDLVRAKLAFVSNRGGDAPTLLVRAAMRLTPIEPALARSTYLEALSAAIFSGRLAPAEGGVFQVARAAAAAPPPPGIPQALDLLLDGTAAALNDGYGAGLPALRKALADFGSGTPRGSDLHWLWLACTTAIRTWDDSAWNSLSMRYLALARGIGDLAELPLALIARAYFLLFSGDLASAAALAEEAQAVNSATGSDLAAYGPMGVAAFRGDHARATELIDATTTDSALRGEGVGITFAEWATALLANGLGRYDEAFRVAERAVRIEPAPGSWIWHVPELVEAAVRSDRSEAVADVYAEFEDMTRTSATDWALGLRRRTGALLTDGDKAEELYRESIDRLGRTRMRADLARAHLLYGEWLRRRNRRRDARGELRTAQAMLAEMGMKAFADRAARELRAAGGTSGKPVHAAIDPELTAQEEQIARLARDGLTNGEIASRLFISSHTVQYHLRKVFAKLGITSRSQLGERLRSNDS
ncbi:helix-turn-helix transcriptional regulator [Amycolatopsis sp. NPDC004368]